MTQQNRHSRREVLMLGAAAAGWPLVNGRAAARPAPIERSTIRPRGARKPRNVIFMVVDGMSAGVPTLAEPFSQLARKRGTHWHRLATSPQWTTFGHMDMASLDSLVTDSAAAASAWGAGVRIANGAVNMLPDGTELASIGPLAKDAGRATGLVTTTRVTHATPAGFGASVPRRGMEDAIAEQYLGKIDVLLGGGRAQFDPEARRDGRDLYTEYQKAGYTRLRNRRDLQRARPADKLLGLFDNSHLPYTIDHRREKDLQRDVPTLAEMTELALKSLAQHREGFLLQVEGGRVDHAAHGNDAAAILWDQIAFDDALGVCVKFIEEHPETLLVITSDHGNANPGLNGMGSGYRGSNDSFARLTRVKASFTDISRRIRSQRRGDDGDADDTESIRKAVKWGTSIELTDEEADVLAAARDGDAVHEMNRQLVGWRGQLGQMLGNHTGVQFTGITHTADWVMLMALGPGRESFEGLLKNTDAFERMAEPLGVKHRNPKAQPEDAERRRRGIGMHAAPADDVAAHWL